MTFLFTIVATRDIIIIVRRKEVQTMTDLTHRIAFRCTEELFENVKEVANDKGLTVTDYITFLLIDDISNYYDGKGGE